MGNRKSSTFKKPWFTTTLCVFLLLLLAWVAALSFASKAPPQSAYDKWRTAEYRLEAAQEMISKKLILNLAEKKVFEILGAPDKDLNTLEMWGYAWSLGERESGGGSLMIPYNEYLAITIKNSVVSDAKIVNFD